MPSVERGRRRRRLASAVLCLPWCVAMSAAPPVVDFSAVEALGDELHFFSIPPQLLSTALLAYAEQAGLQIIFRTDLLQGYRSPGIHGTYTIADATLALLAETGFSIEFVGPRTAVVAAAGADPRSR